MATFLEPKAYDKDKAYSVGDFVVAKNEEELGYFMNIHASENDNISDDNWWHANAVPPQ